MVLVAKTVNSPTSITCTLMRSYGTGIANNSHEAANPSGNTHDVGWTPFMAPPLGYGGNAGYVNNTDPTNTFIPMNPNFGNCHSDTAYGFNGTYTFAGGCSDSISNVSIQQLLTANPVSTFNANPVFAGATTSQLSYGNLVESYPGHRQKLASFNETVWEGDWRAYNPDFGTDQTGGGNWASGSNPTLLGGTAHTYKIRNISGATDIKRTPLYGFAGPRIFQDVSGPSSSIGDTILDAFCYAYNAGECRSGSAKGDLYLSAQGLDVSGTNCLTNTYNDVVPCVFGLNSAGPLAVQAQINPVDTQARYIRRLTYGLAAPAMHFSFQNWLQSPEGRWGFFVAPYVNGLRGDYYAMKLPPWPNLDHDRGTFIPVPVSLPPAPGAQYARARFGYAEYGPATSFFCTSRQEACSTDIPTAASGDPYSFLSEPVSHLNCSARCTVSIPAVPGRVLYYVIDRLNAAGAVLSSSPLRAVAIP